MDMVEMTMVDVDMVDMDMVDVDMVDMDMHIPWDRVITIWWIFYTKKLNSFYLHNNVKPDETIKQTIQIYAKKECMHYICSVNISSPSFIINSLLLIWLDI